MNHDPINPNKEPFFNRFRHIKDARLSFSTYLASLIIILALGVVIGARTPIYNAIMQHIGLATLSTGPTLDLSSVEQTYKALATHYDGTLDPQKLIDGANHGMVAAAGDQFTVYFDKDEASSFSDDLSGSFQGIGAELGLNGGVLSVVSTLDSSPAKAAGLQAGDSILKVNGQSTNGWTIEKAADTIRGPQGSKVTLSILRSGETEPKDYTITRQALTDPSVTSKIQDNVGILSISRFGQDTADLATKAAQSFKQANVKGVILDLRGDGGGYVDAAQSVASLWLNNKIIATERNGATVTDTIHSDDNPLLGGIPTVVLIDGGSASASEIVSGALHDNHAATLMGTKSYGKGSVQDVLNLSDGAELKVTIAKWYTPDGKNINQQGITPDQTITPTSDQINAGQDPVLDAALSKLK